MKSIAITEFKAHCLSLLEAVATTGEPLIVTKRGKPLARVVPSGATGTFPQTLLHGSVIVSGDVVAPVLDATAWDAVRGNLHGEKPRTKKKIGKASRGRAR